MSEIISNLKAKQQAEDELANIKLPQNIIEIINLAKIRYYKNKCDYLGFYINLSQKSCIPLIRDILLTENWVYLDEIYNPYGYSILLKFNYLDNQVDII